MKIWAQMRTACHSPFQFEIHFEKLINEDWYIFLSVQQLRKLQQRNTN